MDQLCPLCRSECEYIEGNEDYLPAWGCTNIDCDFYKEIDTPEPDIDAIEEQREEAKV